MSSVESGNNTILRPSRPGEGQSLYDVTARSIQALGKQYYSSDQLAGWMGERTADYYEDMIKKNKSFVAEKNGEIQGFVDATPGEVTRLFLLPKAAGQGLGKRLLRLGVEIAAEGYAGPIRVEATLNAHKFYERNGFKTVGKGYFSHGVGGDPIEIVLMEMNQSRFVMI